ncbi:MAG: hypothetical protein JO257_09430 [Deltaproteobacteria bacterium]|nr:hypothetical protein [Deltaproteobacteria bacterium]
MRISQVAIIASLLAASATADAKPRRVVVLDFDGPRVLADVGRSSVMSLLGDQYDVVATRRWETARAQAAGHGPQQWRQAAKQAGVDAVIEGWVQDEGRHHVMTVAVRDAATGNEIDTITIKLGSSGVSTDQGHQLAAQLDDIFGFIDDDPTASQTTSSLPDVRTMRPMLGAHHEPAPAQDDADDDEAPKPKHHKKHHRVVQQDDADDQDEEEAPEPKKPEPKKVVATATDDQKDESDLVTLFGPDSKEAAIVSEGKTSHIARPTPRFAISAGGYYSSRGITFDHDPNAKNTVDFPASSIHGMQIQAEVFPAPLKKQDGGLSGLGFSASIAHSLGTTFTAMDSSGYGDYTYNHSQWELGAHYRYPIDMVTFDGGVSYGNVTHTIVDLPSSIAIPDTAYSYVSAGAHLSLAVSDRANIGFGAKYLYLLETGDISSEDWFGAGTAWGMTLSGDFTIPLPSNLYVRGDLEYRRITLDFEGSGALVPTYGMWGASDTAITGSANLGINF